MSNETNTITADSATIATKALEQTIAGLKEGMAKASASAAQVQAQAQATVKEGSDAAIKKTEELVRFAQGNIEALTKSTQIWTAGVQDLSKQVAASVQASFQETVGTFKTIGSVKSVKEAIELQTALARTAVEKAISEGGRLSEASLQLTKQTFAPIVDRLTIARETFGKRI